MVMYSHRETELPTSQTSIEWRPCSLNQKERALYRSCKSRRWSVPARVLALRTRLLRINYPAAKSDCVSTSTRPSDNHRHHRVLFATPISHQKGGGTMSTNITMRQEVDPPSVPSDSGMGTTIISTAVISAAPTWLPKPTRYATSLGHQYLCRSILTLQI